MLLHAPPVGHTQRRGRKVSLVKVLPHVEGVGELAGTVREIDVSMDAAGFAHEHSARLRLDGPNKDGPRRAFRFGHDVQEPVHPVDEVDVGRSGSGKKIPAPSPTGHSPGLRVFRQMRGVTGRVVLSVGLRLHDTTDELPCLRVFMDETTPEKLPRDLNSGTVEK